MSVEVPEVSVRELADRLAARERGEEHFLLVDVRESGELEIAHLPGAEHVPLAEVLMDEGRRIGQLAKGTPVLVLCRSGGRSAYAVALLRQRLGIDAANVAGGILAWSEHIDPEVPTY